MTNHSGYSGSDSAKIQAIAAALNEVARVPMVDLITIDTATAAHVYTFGFGAETCTYTALTPTSKAAIATGLAADFNSRAGCGDVATALAGAITVQFTAKVGGVPYVISAVDALCTLTHPTPNGSTILSILASVGTSLPALIGLFGDAAKKSGVSGNLFQHLTSAQDNIGYYDDTAAAGGAAGSAQAHIRQALADIATVDGIVDTISTAVVTTIPATLGSTVQVTLGAALDRIDSLIGEPPEDVAASLATIAADVVETAKCHPQSFFYNCTLAMNAVETTFGAVGTQRVALTRIAIDPQALPDPAKLTSLCLRLRRGALPGGTLRSALLDDAALPAAALTVGATGLVWSGYIICEVNDILTLDPTPVAADADALHLHVEVEYHALADGGVIA
jgi:hypothetical protein